MIIGPDVEITLNDGTPLFASDVAFDPATYRFLTSYDLENPTYDYDITMGVKVSDKRMWSEFDITTWNNLYYMAIHPGSVPVGSDSFMVNLGNQIYNDPLAAPVEQATTVLRNSITAANHAGSSIVGSLFSNPWVLLAVVGVAFVYFSGRGEGLSGVRKRYLD